MMEVWFLVLGLLLPAEVGLLFSIVLFQKRTACVASTFSTACEI